MLPNNLAASLPRLSARLQLPFGWQAPLIRLWLAWLALVLAFRADWAAMIGQWWNISTYNHILLIPAIMLWLIFQRLDQLGRLRPATWWPGLALFAGALLLWLLGAFAGLAIVRQVGAVAMLGCATL